MGWAAEVQRVAEYLVTGAGGQVGRALLRSAPGCTVGMTHADLDVADAAAVSRVLTNAHPSVVLHTAAWTDVDGCERAPDRAWVINAEGTANLARASAAIGARLIYISTDYVFNGQGSRPYEPMDAVGPVSAYGRSKLAGELATRLLAGDGHAIVRTSWVFARDGRNFVNTMLRLAQTQEELRVVDDQRGSPTYAPDLADWIWRLVSLGATGTFHACNGGECTWYEFAREILRLAPSGAHVTPVTTAEFPRPAQRPAYSVLRPSWQDAGVGTPMRHWRDALQEMCSHLPSEEIS